MRTKLLILSIIVSAGFSFASDAVLFGNVLESDLILTPEGITNAILTTALTVESDPLAYPVATNALALAEGALQPDATNGLLRVEADTLATVTARGATTASAVAIGSRGAGAVGVYSLANGDNVVASGYASHAEGLGTTASGDTSHAEGSETAASGRYSHAEGFGTTASAYASHAEGFGTTASGFASHAEGSETAASGRYSHASGYNAVASNITAFAWQGAASDQFDEPEYGSHGAGTFNVNPVGGLAGLWIGETNLAATLSAYATTGAVAAVHAEVAGKADAETVVSGAVGVATAGNRYFWTSATNVVLSVGLTGGQVVNYAALRNTATNAITATASTSGWKWTGGSMTNSIPAGKMMTFGWAVDPSTGATNAYATAASGN